MNEIEDKAEEKSLDFIREQIRADLESGAHEKIVTRFPPEPNGYLHIGHVKTISRNGGVAAECGGEVAIFALMTQILRKRIRNLLTQSGTTSNGLGAIGARRFIMPLIILINSTTMRRNWLNPERGSPMCDDLSCGRGARIPRYAHRAGSQ